MTAPRLGNVEPCQQPAAGDPEQVGHRDLVAETDQRRVHPVLERRAVLDQVQPKREISRSRRSSTVGSQIAGTRSRTRQLRQHARVDLVGLARQRRQPLDPLRVGDQHLPAVRDELVVHEPRPVHRFHHAPDRLVVDRDAAREPVQAVAVRRRPELIDQLALAGDQADIDPPAAQVQPNMQHALSLLSRRGAGRISRSHRVPSPVVGSLSRMASPRG